MKRNYISRIFLYIGVIIFLLSSCLWSQASKSNKEGGHYLKLFEGWEFCLTAPLKEEENPLLQLSRTVEQQWHSYEELLSSFSFRNFMLVSGMTPWEALSHRLQDRLRLNIFEFIQGIIIFIVGIAALILFLFFLKPHDRALLYFALFAFLYGLRILADNYWIRYIYENIQFLQYLTAFITYTIGAFFILFMKQFIGWGWKSSLFRKFSLERGKISIRLSNSTIKRMKTFC